MPSVNYARLKTNLSLAIQRLKLLEKKKTESAQKSRKEIADYIENGKVERAKIRVEHIIREDYLVEAMEIVEMFCDLLLARFGMIQQMPTLDDGLEEAISSLIWVAPRMSTDVKELSIIAELFTQKYGKQFAQAAKENQLKSVNEKLMLKLGVQAPPKILVEKYLIEIAKTLNVHYEPDEEVLMEDKKYNQGNDDSKPGASGGSGGAAQRPPPGSMSGLLIDLAPTAPTTNEPPPLPDMPPSGPYGNLASEADFLKKQLSDGRPPEIGFIDLPPQPLDAGASVPPSYESVVSNQSTKSLPAPSGPPPPEVPPASASAKPEFNLDNLPPVYNLPDIPSELDDFGTNNKSTHDGSSSNKRNDGNGSGAGGQDDVDFDDLRRRFEDLKKRNN
ncbi:Vacuolar protein sorting-associated protein ist1 [Dermatophagoides pteronyssinus]|uniref:IST1 homolog n=1 Tax=Dermatophagoides pteronyssinus TaxID=6956 RepID=A0ABQ8JST2_DERPT|nr:Vacuolar protein sorting-associated protein ist1 [Dermatophagoides pteronyssinus]